MQQVFFIIGLIHALHQHRLARTLGGIGLAIRVQAADQLAVNLTDRLAGALRLQPGFGLTLKLLTCFGASAARLIPALLRFKILRLHRFDLRLDLRHHVLHGLRPGIVSIEIHAQHFFGHSFKTAGCCAFFSVKIGVAVFVVDRFETVVIKRRDQRLRQIADQNLHHTLLRPGKLVTIQRMVKGVKQVFLNVSKRFAQWQVFGHYLLVIGLGGNLPVGQLLSAQLDFLDQCIERHLPLAQIGLVGLRGNADRRGGFEHE